MSEQITIPVPAEIRRLIEERRAEIRELKKLHAMALAADRANINHQQAQHLSATGGDNAEH